MQILHFVEPLTAEVARWKAQGLTVGFVPTMGDLHEGHMRLIRDARKQSDRLVVSIFVNPLQFGPGEDFDRYPRRLDRDSGLLENEHVDIVFAPDNEAMYPQGAGKVEHVSAGELGGILCGATRPGHFDGVATVVNRLFAIVQPDFAVFGQKDYQQLQVIRRLVAERGLAIEILSVPTHREADGLAMSTRNQYLNKHQRAIAPLLYSELQKASGRIAGDFSAAEEIIAASLLRLDVAGLKPIYLELRRAIDLAEPAEQDKDLVLLTAARLGETRLIDNLVFSVGSLVVGPGDG